MVLALVLSINEDIIQIYNNINIEIFGQDLIDVSLKAGRNIQKAKKYYLILKVAITSLKGRFLLIAFFYSYLVVSVS